MALPADADIPRILSRLRPDAEWAMLGDDMSVYADLDWRDLVQAKPTELELEAEWAVIETEDAAALAVINAIKANVNAVAGSTWAAITNAERTNVLEAVLYALGGIDPVTREIRPAAQWDVARKLAGV